MSPTVSGEQFPPGTKSFSTYFQILWCVKFTMQIRWPPYHFSISWPKTLPRSATISPGSNRIRKPSAGIKTEPPCVKCPPAIKICHPFSKSRLSTWNEVFRLYISDLPSMRSSSMSANTLTSGNNFLVVFLRLSRPLWNRGSRKERKLFTLTEMKLVVSMKRRICLRHLDVCIIDLEGEGSTFWKKHVKFNFRPKSSMDYIPRAQHHASI